MSERKKQKPEEKVKIVKRYLAGEVSMSEAVTEAGVNWKTLQKWVMQYEAEGAAAFLPGRREHIDSPELKLQAEFSKKYGLRDRRQLRNWLKVYHAHGDFNSRKNSGGGSCMRQGRDTTQEERIQIVKDCLASGKNYGEMALKYKVSYQQVRTWTLRFEEMGEAGLEDRRGKRKKDQKPRTELEKAQIEIEQLKHKLYLAEMERDLLKKLDEIEWRDAFRK
mgnify:FL=1